MIIGLVILTLVGFVLSWQGVVGRYRWHDPCCRRCGYDLHGERSVEAAGAAPRTCPECGRALSKPGGIRFARRQRGWGRALVGTVLLAAVGGACLSWPNKVLEALQWTAYRIGIKHARIDVMERRALSRLSNEQLIDEIGDASSWHWLAEVKLREAGGGWTSEHDLRIADRLTRLDSEHEIFQRERMLCEVLDLALQRSSLSEDQWARLAEASGDDPDFGIPARMPVGRRVQLGDRGRPWGVFKSEWDIDAVRVNGEDLDRYTLKATEVGTMVVEIEATWWLRFGRVSGAMTSNRKRGHILERAITRRFVVEVLAEDAPTVGRFSNTEIDARECVTVGRFAVNRLQGQSYLYADWSVEPDLPAALYVTATLTLGDQDVPLGTFGKVKTKNGQHSIGGPTTGFIEIDPLDQSVVRGTLTLTPDDSEAWRRRDFDPIWGDPIVIDIEVGRFDGEEEDGAIGARGEGGP